MDGSRTVDFEAWIPTNHHLRLIRGLLEEALLVLSLEFERVYLKSGRPSIAPENVLRALLPQSFCNIRSERQLIEQLNCNLLLRWLVGLSVDERVWDAAVYSKSGLPCPDVLACPRRRTRRVLFPFGGVGRYDQKAGRSMQRKGAGR